MPHQSHPHSFYHPNYIWSGVQIMKLLIMHFSSASCYFLPHKTKYSPQHPILKHPQYSSLTAKFYTHTKQQVKLVFHILI